MKANFLSAIFIVALIFCCTIYAQDKKDSFEKTIEDLITNDSSVHIDSVYNNLKRQALELNQDSLYVELTFQQIEKNGGLLVYTYAEILLENLLINQNYFLKKHPKLLLRCIHDLGKFYLLQSGSSKVSKKISEQYYKRYFALLEEVDLSEEELKTAEQNKLKYLVYTKNDSVFYYLNQYDVNQKNEAELLNQWYRGVEDYTKELEYAKILDDKIKIIIAYKNNTQFDAINRLYSDYVSFFKNTEDQLSEHKLYLIMGQIYFSQKRYQEAENMYLKALSYFEQKKSNLFTNVIYNDLIELKMKNGDLSGYSFYSNKFNAQKKEYREQQLAVLNKHIDYATKVSDFEIQLNLNKEKLKNEALSNKINTQKTIISFALALFIVVLIFVYFYSVSSKTRTDLENANKQMVIDVLRSKFKPHFTFNVLSVINYFVEKKEVYNATIALTKMSSLLRATLDNMNEKLVPFISEYNICLNYMYLESLRFSDKFEYEFEPINDFEVEQWMIPPGVIEPLLENAVNHAFKGVDYKGKIVLKHKILDDSLVITVRDNGVGLKSSGLINKNSHGLKITRDYIQTVSNLYKKPISLNIKSKNGTLIEIVIPRLEDYD